MKNHLPGIVALLGLSLNAALAGGMVQVAGKDVPAAEQGIGVDAQLGAELDPQIWFRDPENNHLELGTLFDGKQPLVLSFNYSDCPKLCSVQLENLTKALRELDFEVGKDFRVVSVSIDPNEQMSRAGQTRDKFTTMYRLASSRSRAEGHEGWHFLTGEDEQIRKLAAECGVRYKYIPQQKLFSHPPVLILVSPEGKIVRYLYGLDVEAPTLKTALVEAAAGKIGSPIYFLTYLTGCYLFDETTGRYSMQWMNLMRATGALTVVGLVIGLAPYLLWKSRPGVVAGKDQPSAAPVSPAVTAHPKT